MLFNLGVMLLYYMTKMTKILLQNQVSTDFENFRGHSMTTDAILFFKSYFGGYSQMAISKLIFGDLCCHNMLTK